MTMNKKPTLTLDVELYQHYLDSGDLTDAEKNQLLETLWIIICEFVRLGFGVHPVQQAQNSGGQENSILADTYVTHYEPQTQEEG